MRAAAALLAGLAVACGSGDASPPPVSAPGPVAVRTVEVRREAVVEPVLGTGTMVADKTTDVGPRVDGIIDQIRVRVGDRVEAGDPLFRTRQVDYRIRVQEAAHALRLARAAGEKARRDRERVERLHESRVASDEQVDAARTADEIAAARLGSAETSLARARQNLEDTVVRAPYAGVITARDVDEGTMMRTMMPGRARVVQLMKIDTVLAMVQIPEVHLPRIHVGTPARLRIDGVDGTRESRVEVLNDSVDRRSRAFEVRLRVDNPDLAIKPGLFVQAELRPEPRPATVLDRRAVLGAGGRHWVLVAADGHAERREVRTRAIDAARVEVLEGLAPGDRVLAGPNLARIREGMPVLTELAHADR